MNIVNLQECIPNRSLFSVTGAVNLVATVFKITLEAVCATSEQKIAASACLVVGPILALFNFGWFIAGNVWVFGQWSTVDLEDVASEHYCEKTAYMFSFVLLILSYVAGPIIAVVCCCSAALCACLAGVTGVAFKSVEQSDKVDDDDE